MDFVSSYKRGYSSLFAFGDQTVAGLKALIMDQPTARGLTLVITQSFNAENEVVANIDVLSLRKATHMPHVKAVAFLTPTQSSVEGICTELSQPKSQIHFAEYHICFTNTPSDIVIDSLARADKYELIKSVRVIFADFVPLGHGLITLSTPMDHQVVATAAGLSKAQRRPFIKAIKAPPAIAAAKLFSALLANGVQPFSVRHSVGSQNAAVFSDTLYRLIQNQSALFEYTEKGARRHQGIVYGAQMSTTKASSLSSGQNTQGTKTRSVRPLEVIVLDRRMDLISPLLHYWTFESLADALFDMGDTGRVHTNQNTQQDVPMSYATSGSTYQDIAYLDYMNVSLNILPALKDQLQTAPTANASAREKMKEAIKLSESFGTKQEVFNAFTVALAIKDKIIERQLLQVFSVEEAIGTGSINDAIGALDDVFNKHKKDDTIGRILENSQGSKRDENAVFYTRMCFRLVLLIALRFNVFLNQGSAVNVTTSGPGLNASHAKKLKAVAEKFFQFVQILVGASPVAATLKRYADAADAFLTTQGPAFYAHNNFYWDNTENSAKGCVTELAGILGADTMKAPRISEMLKSVGRSSIEDTTPYFSYKPRILSLVEAALSNKLLDKEFPYANGVNTGLVADVKSSTSVHDVLVFILGGVTFGEAASLQVHEFYASHSKGTKGKSLLEKLCTITGKNACVCGSDILSPNRLVDDLVDSILSGDLL